MPTPPIINGVEARCFRCKWWDAIDSERTGSPDIIRRCTVNGPMTLFPATDFQLRDRQSATWPSTDSIHWCAKFEKAT